MSLNANHLRRTIATLQRAITEIQQVADENDILYDLFRNAAIKSFELSLETSGNLLRKALKLYGGSPRKIDGLVFKDVFRHANKHDILDEATVLRWFAYRDNRNVTTHDYGEGFANETLEILPEYIQDATALADRLEEIFRAAA
ncbi:MAG: nucleotidyltransferase substrate binding protein [Rhodocyclaceae bacterium]|nr:nucleotidyltransferase substrate binding protein [Rhodocyclaceae bacterium]MBR4737100.1 nucleotidyltransferase substrate binding protein [Rhodocyclaceae bacterium]